MQMRSKQNVRGLDVSHWQGDVDWEKVQEVGIRFVYMKVSEGSTIVDPMFEKNERLAKETGLFVGGYHFGRFNNEIEARMEAAHFVDQLKTKVHELPPVLDLETNQGLGPEQLSKCALIFAEVVKEQLGRDLMIYTSSYFARDHLSQELKELRLWIAHYGVEQPIENGIWKKWEVFQFSDQGQVSGIKGLVDLDEWEMSSFERLLAEIRSSPHSSQDIQSKYKIKKGDTFWQLETDNGWNHGSLEHLNPNLDPRKLQIGAMIHIPK